MTDNDIVKALEEELKTALTINHRFEESNDTENPDDHKFIALLINTIKLINRKNAEIERLERHTEMYHEVRAEAVKEFAKRFENELTKIEDIYIDEEHENFISANKVIALLVNLVKEMGGEGDERT